MSLWGTIEDLGSSVWDGVSSAWGGLGDGLSALWHGLGGFLSIITNFLKNLFSHVALLWELPMIYLFGWMPEKQLKLRVVILRDEDGDAIAPRDRVDSAVAIAQRVFKSELNVVVKGAHGDIVREPADPAPSYVLEPPCSTGVSDVHTQIGPIFGKAGAWYRSRLARTPGGTFLGYGTPVTMFVVRDVQSNKIGCAHIAWFENYGYIEPAALPPSDGLDDVESFEDRDHSTLPHEIGHCCDLLAHRAQKVNLMHGAQATRTGTALTKWQKAVARTSTHITFL